MSSFQQSKLGRGHPVRNQKVTGREFRNTEEAGTPRKGLEEDSKDRNSPTDGANPVTDTGSVAHPCNAASPFPRMRPFQKTVCFKATADLPPLPHPHYHVAFKHSARVVSSKSINLPGFSLMGQPMFIRVQNFLLSAT